MSEAYLDEARYQATQDMAEALLRACRDVIALHGEDPRTPDIVAASFAIALCRLGTHMNADIPTNVCVILEKFP